MTITHPSKIYLKPHVSQDSLKKYGFRIVREQWKGGSPIVSMTIAHRDVVYEGIRYETYNLDGIGLCECLEINHHSSPVDP